GDIKNDGAKKLDEQMKTMMNIYHVGGVALFSKNIVEPTQLTTFIEDMQQASEVPLFVGVDEEGGIVSRIASSPGFDVP
ncbi:MAG: glycoside hydrolase family 3 N-terminal domain-containing protein, partial [Clostridium sp.]